MSSIIFALSGGYGTSRDPASSFFLLLLAVQMHLMYTTCIHLHTMARLRPYIIGTCTGGGTARRHTARRYTALHGTARHCTGTALHPALFYVMPSPENYAYIIMCFDHLNSWGCREAQLP